MSKFNTSSEKNQSNLMKRARSKYVSRGLTHHLTSRLKDSPLIKSYRNTWYCTDIIQKSDKGVKATYCKNRWCPVCNRIRTGQAISGYKPTLETFKDPYFVTLTAKTIKENQLLPRIKQMAKVFTAIATTARNSVGIVGFQGVRSLECTARPEDLYHPHYHIILDGKHHAQWLIKSWLRHFKGYATAKAQDMRKADERSYKELFKYATKLSVLAKDKNAGIDIKIGANRLDVIFRALRNKRLFQPFGGIRKIKEEEFEQLEQINTEEIVGDSWQWQGKDWIERTTGSPLTGHEPSDKHKSLWLDGEKMKEPKQNPHFQYKDKF